MRGTLAATLFAVACVFAAPGLAAVAPAATTPAVASRGTPYPGLLTIDIDLRDAPSRIYRVHETIPVHAGPLTLYYPKWPLPDHAPDGAIANIAGFIVTAGGKPLRWRRDGADMYSFHLDVPSGVETLDLTFQYLSPGDGVWFGYEVWSTPHLADLDPTQVAFYPAGHDVRDIRIQPTVTLPAGWKFATALDVASRAGDTIRFRPLSFADFIDSPLIAGEHFTRVDLDPGAKAPVHLDVVGDRAAEVVVTAAQLAHYRSLVRQLHALFGSRHYAHYDLLLTVSDDVDGTGLEHHQSSLNMSAANFLTDADAFAAGATLMPHEFTHSWNGKFRRPADLYTATFNEVQPGDMIWAYEGLTEYWANVLTARSGLWTQAQYRDALASTAAMLAHRTGRTWRSLQDTADSAQLLYFNGGQWTNYRRATDFYPEGNLLWLDVDTKIRELSHGRRSLDDFARAFYGMDDGSRVTRTYTYAELIAALDRVQPFDWARFLRQRLDYTGPDLPEQGIARAGWKLAYTDVQSSYDQAVDRAHGTTDLAYSIGATMDRAGVVRDVQWDGPAYRAGLVPGMRIVAVDGSRYAAAALRTAITNATRGTAPIGLLVRYLGTYRSLHVDYHDGLRYPHLVRVDGTPDYLGAIAAERK